MPNDPSSHTNRRAFLRAATALTGSSILPCSHSFLQGSSSENTPVYGGPNIIIIRFGGGVRRRETIDPQHTYSPYVCKELSKRGTLYTNMVLDSIEDVETSHGQGTLYILTGKYAKYQDIQEKFLSERFAAKVPTVFEYLRKAYRIPEHQTLIINGEDRKQEEFYSFSNHHLFGVNYKSEVLSLYRYKVYLLRRQIAEGKWTGKSLVEKTNELENLETFDYRADSLRNQADPILRFWNQWRNFYGEGGLVNPRGDRLLTELTLRALQQLRPKLLMVNYNDPDYVHWGNMNHYTRGISIIDQSVKRLVNAVEADEEYRENTIFVIVPDCGRDTNPLLSVPCQHHFNSRSAHEIWALLIGPGIREGVVIDKEAHQISLAATIGHLAKMETAFAEGPVLEDAIA